jgi:hypothetical protein
LNISRLRNPNPRISSSDDPGSPRVPSGVIPEHWPSGDSLRGLDETRTHQTLGYYTTAGATPAAITVYVTASGDERWEVEFFDNGAVEIERFTSTGGVDDASVDDLLAELRRDA